MSITFLQKILCGKLPTEICYENVVNITPLIKVWAKNTNY